MYQNEIMETELAKKKARVEEHARQIKTLIESGQMERVAKYANDLAEMYENASSRETVDRLQANVKRAEEQARFVGNMLNDGRFNRELFFKAMDNEHRTLQSEFGELCLKWFEHCASEDYRTDGRNDWMKTKGRLLRKDNHI